MKEPKFFTASFVFFSEKAGLMPWELRGDSNETAVALYAPPAFARVAMDADSDLIRPPIPKVIRPLFRSLSGHRSESYPATVPI
ncbi:MAG: hypothetical protein P4L50_13465 [Anaerolineaceae bacterium]|nr:hypothetical protein [Anaerolineaceae bacterium]